MRTCIHFTSDETQKIAEALRLSNDPDIQKLSKRLDDAMDDAETTGGGNLEVCSDDAEDEEDQD